MSINAGESGTERKVSSDKKPDKQFRPGQQQYSDWEKSQGAGVGTSKEQGQQPIKK